jgi:VanZ family protein
LLHPPQRDKQSISHKQVMLRIAFGLGVCAIVVGSLLPAAHAPVFINDKAAHFLAYALLGLIGTWMLSAKRRIALLVLFICTLAVVLEISQRFSPGRSIEIADTIVSCLGACSAAVLRILVSLRLL